MRPNIPASGPATRLALPVSLFLAVFLFVPAGLSAGTQMSRPSKAKPSKAASNASATDPRSNESADVSAMLRTAQTAKLALTSDEIKEILANSSWHDKAKDIKEAAKHCNNPNWVWRDAGTPYEDAAWSCSIVASRLVEDVGPGNPDTELAFQRACALPRYPRIARDAVMYNLCAELGNLYMARACAAPLSAFSPASLPADYCSHLGEWKQDRDKNLRLALAVFQSAPNCQPDGYTAYSPDLFETACPIGAANALRAQGKQSQGEAAMRSACSRFSPSGGYPGDCLGFVPQVAQQTDSDTSNDQLASGDQQANEAAQNRQEIQDKIDSLNNEIQQLESDANDADQNADNLASNSNCTGGFGAYAQIAQQGCENINSIGVAKFRSQAAKDRNQADDDRAEIARLQGEEVQEAPHRDASFGGALAQQMQQNPQPSIVDTANQQAANMIAVGAANDAARAQAAAQRREQAEEQQRQQQAQQAAASSSNDSSSGNGGSSGGVTCTNESNFVTGTSKLNPDGLAVGFLTNNSNQPLWVTYTFARGGQPDKNQAGSLTLKPGQTVGGEGGGIWAVTSGAAAVDSSPVKIYWFAVPLSDENKLCGTPW